MISINKLLVFLWTLLLLSFRPSIIAQSYNKVVFCLFALTSVLLISLQKDKNYFRISKKEASLLVLLFSTFFYFIIQGLFLSSAKTTVINSGTVLLGTTPCLFLIVRTPYNRDLIVKYIINIHYVLSISQIITFLYFLLIGCKMDQLPVITDLQEIAKYHFENNVSHIHYLVFPFTITWSNFLIFNTEFYRTCGMYREPGMAQLFYLTAFFLTFFYRAKHLTFKRVIILIGSLLLFSGSGFMNLIIGLVAYFVFNKLNSHTITKKTAIQLSFGICAIAIFSIFTLSVVSKKFENESGFERIKNIKNSLNSLNSSPVFGEGYYNDFTVSSEGLVTSDAFLSFIGVLNQIGFFGALMYASCWIASLYYFANRYSICIYLPCLITLLTSQPSYNDVFVWFLMFFNTSQFLPEDQFSA